MASIAVEQITDFKLAVQRTRARFQHPLTNLLVPLSLILLFAFIYTPPRWQDWNQNSRFNLTRAIVNDGSVRIDRYAANTGDYAVIDGHVYSDKAPGLSLMAVPVYALTRAIEPYGLEQLSHRLGESERFTETLNPDGQGLSSDRIDTAVALYIATILTVSVPAVVMLLLLAIIIERLSGCRTAATLTVLAIGLTTPVFSYSQAFYGHIPAAACVVGILALLLIDNPGPTSTGRLIGVGLLAGWAIVIEYPVAVILVPLAIWIVYRDRGPAVIYGLAGMIPPLLVLATYDFIAFGTLAPIGYEHSALWQEQHSTGFMSLTYPHPDALWGLTFSRFRGLFILAPILLLALPGIVLGLRRRDTRALFAGLGISAVAFFLFISSSIMWWGGFSVGPRYLAPAIPLLALPLGLMIGYLNGQSAVRRTAGLLTVGVLGAISGALVWATTFAGQNYPSDTIRDPLVTYVMPAIRDGEIARNLGMAIQLSGIWSLVPLFVAMAIGVAVVGKRLLTPRMAPA